MRSLVSKIHPVYRPILLGVLLFLCFNVIVTLGVTFSPVNQKFNFSYGNFLPTKLGMLKNQPPGSVNTLFLGTSQTNNGFITSEFDKATQGAFQSFNLGLPNNRYDIMQAYLTYHVHQYGKPKLVLLELSPSIQETNSDFYYLPALYYRTLLERSPQQVQSFLAHPFLAWNVKKELMLSGFSSLYQYRFTFSPVNMLDKVTGKIQNILHRSASIEGVPMAISKPPIFQVTDEMTAKGWYPKEQSPHMLSPEGIQLSVVEAKKYYIDHQDTVNFEKLRLLLAYCREQKIPVVLVAWPNHPAFLRLFSASKLNTQYQKGLQALLAKEPVPVINLNQKLTLQDEQRYDLFADPRHLTPQGAQYFSRILAQQISSLALFPQPSRLVSKTGESLYASELKE